MFTGQVDIISNKATWASQNCILVDEDDLTITDLSDPALTLDIVVTIKEVSDFCQNIRATASLANGKVQIAAPGFQWQFEVSDLSCLCAGTYKLGVKVTINGFVNDVIDGTIGVIEGN